MTTYNYTMTESTKLIPTPISNYYVVANTIQVSQTKFKNYQIK